jgi:hypothetical protein
LVIENATLFVVAVAVGHIFSFISWTNRQMGHYECMVYGVCEVGDAPVMHDIGLVI